MLVHAPFFIVISCVLFSCCDTAPKVEFCCSFKADREQSFSPVFANFLISTKRHLNHLSVSYRSSGKRRQAGQQNKQTTNTPPSNLSWNKWTKAARGGNNQTTKPAHQPIEHQDAQMILRMWRIGPAKCK